MTTEIKLRFSTLEHMQKQPEGLRYALFCFDPNCEFQKQGGHVGDYRDYQGVRTDALVHPHPVIIRFYPDRNTRVPSEDFLADFGKQ